MLDFFGQTSLHARLAVQMIVPFVAYLVTEENGQVLVAAALAVLPGSVVAKLDTVCSDRNTDFGAKRCLSFVSRVAASQSERLWEQCWAQRPGGGEGQRAAWACEKK
eukprot:TRINITY_DN16062_c0_g1_i1.p3 TRINITY_DN16062_c0_g1~~TRINITY_DN16062_c0_g1_i1.p3  ORF type:complete len:107 (+),score=8.65 TRINITY_DN16062_c0_g1_i1:177-497(+)